MIYILYSNDYEVYLGGNYYPESDVLIEITNRVLSTCDDIGIPMTLFCDLPCLWRYRELGLGEFPDLVDNQLKQAVATGHDIQAHIHPHWAKTEIVYKEDGTSKYDFDLSTYLLGNWIPEGGTALRRLCTDILRRAKSYLENILRPVRPSYRCIAFRAGGYGIQPNTKEIFKALVDTGYLIDSSVVPGMVLRSNVNRIDFSQVPRKGNYFISSELGLNKDSEKGIFEIPILALRQGEDSWFLAKSFMRRAVKYSIKHTMLGPLIYATPRPMGYTIQSTDLTEKRKTFPGKILAKVNDIRHGGWMLELDTDANTMVNATRQYIDRFGKNEGDLYLSLSCHSKNTNPILLNSLKKYHHRLKSIYGEQLKAITFQEAACNLNLV